VSRDDDKIEIVDARAFARLERRIA